MTRMKILHKIIRITGFKFEVQERFQRDLYFREGQSEEEGVSCKYLIASFIPWTLIYVLQSKL